MEITEILITGNSFLDIFKQPMTLMIIVMFGVMYFVMIRPQRKQKEEAEKLRTSLKAGDRIVTIGGIHGVIERVNKSTVHILSADKTLMEFSTDSILRRVEAESTDKKDKK